MTSSDDYNSETQIVGYQSFAIKYPIEPTVNSTFPVFYSKCSHSDAVPYSISAYGHSKGWQLEFYKAPNWDSAYTYVPNSFLYLYAITW
jgi:hypothetical protein